MHINLWSTYMQTQKELGQWGNEGSPQQLWLTDQWDSGVKEGDGLSLTGESGVHSHHSLHPLPKRVPTQQLYGETYTVDHTLYYTCMVRMNPAIYKQLILPIFFCAYNAWSFVCHWCRSKWFTIYVIWLQALLTYVAVTVPLMRSSVFSIWEGPVTSTSNLGRTVRERREIALPYTTKAPYQAWRRDRYANPVLSHSILFVTFEFESRPVTRRLLTKLVHSESAAGTDIAKVEPTLVLLTILYTHTHTQEVTLYTIVQA